MKCTHKKTILETYKEDEWCPFDMDFIEVEHQRWAEVSTLEDLDLHRLKCSMCGGIEYYSKAAKDFYTKGIKSHGIQGLY